jgi:hypothetical protein
MIRRGARTFLGLLLCLLAFTTSASAECAWVLWGQTVGDIWERLEDGRLVPSSKNLRLPDLWVERAFPTYQECETVRQADFAPQSGKVLVVPFGDSKQSVWVKGHFKCLPDTIDPRKGK